MCLIGGNYLQVECQLYRTKLPSGGVPVVCDLIGRKLSSGGVPFVYV